MTRQVRGAVHPMVKLRNEITIPIDSQLYSYCSRMKQTPVRSMLMAHGCCFDFFEKGICKAGNDCKYSHLKPGDERNLVMDSEAGLRRKKYYRPETLETYRPGSQDVICFTFARKGWCIHGDKCWNQHIAPPDNLFQELGPRTLNGLPISNSPSPDRDDIPNFPDTGYGSGFGITQPLAQHHLLTNTPSPSGLTNPHWSSSTISPMQTGQYSGQYSGQHPGPTLGQYPGQHSGHSGQYSGQYSGQHPGQYSGQHSGSFGKHKQSNDQFISRGHAQNKGTYFCHPDPQRTAAPNWRVPNASTTNATSTPSPVQAVPVFKATPAPVFKATPAPVLKVAPVLKATPAPIAKPLPVQVPVVKPVPTQATVVKTSPVTVQPQPIRSALTEFNWRPVIHDQPSEWRKVNGTKKPTATVPLNRPVLPALQIPTRTGAGNTGNNYNYNLFDLSNVNDQHKYRIGSFGIGRVQPTVPSMLH
ncbi:hypothetical protein TWF173_001603 [Orbilia oligospora]|uniref:C3H1-type domain-containing protein n=2 Tax=Orbilia oligospora TaxID=2813651 RepID=G1XNV5_ARTOA|nr:hypothetical protein AOL_s00173g123 [Orbilia oligospora ATCC 24927]EGX45022.1 hypothetical protein AOL_s00173g123 [Orbilia oligospora ATCC 24927]KAF3286726.1 hypothetical protein TWF970_008570 [Orbilia oligospora]KAF3308236.1 hypothetical protein TWF173_001603 [Orbilia oligospora]